MLNELKAKLSSGSDADALAYIRSLSDGQQKDLIVDLAMEAGSGDDLTRYNALLEKLERVEEEIEATKTPAADQPDAGKSNGAAKNAPPPQKKAEVFPPKPSDNAAETAGCGCSPGSCTVM